jgi:hypothetical protein
MDNVVVIDNFLPNFEYQRINRFVNSESFFWYFEKNISNPDSKSSFYDYGFENWICDENRYNNREDKSIFDPLFSRLFDLTKRKNIHRCRFDMTTYSPVKYKHRAHVDDFVDHLVSILYFSNTDAETIIYENKCYTKEEYYNYDFNSLKVLRSVEPKENRMLLFDGRRLHTGHSPSDCVNRILLNTNLT